VSATAVELEQYNQSIEEFYDYGYVLIPNMLTRNHVESLVEALSGMTREISERERWATEREMLQDPQFYEVVTHPRLIGTVRRIIGDDVQNIDFLGVEQAPHSGPVRGWHLDYPGLGRMRTDRVGGGVTPPGMACPLYLQDMTDEVGPLRVIPGSHKWQRQVRSDERAVPKQHELVFNIPAGSVVCMHGNLWHSGSRNDSDDWRRLFTINFAPWWMKRLDHYYKTPLPDYILESEDPFIRQLFGLEQPASSDQGGYDELRYGV
jgi:ectoine hydroxylase-related dioxygenase (phytanoyl-CoA dioxygenase family)